MFNWPTARIGVMEGDSAVVTLYSVELEKFKGGPLPEDFKDAIKKNARRLRTLAKLPRCRGARPLRRHHRPAGDAQGADLSAGGGGERRATIMIHRCKS